MRAGPPTAPLSCNSEHELVGFGLEEFYHDPESSSVMVSSSIPEFWPSQVSWTALTSRPYLDSAIDHVQIWQTVLCFSCAHGMNRSVQNRGLCQPETPTLVCVLVQVEATSKHVCFSFLAPCIVIKSLIKALNIDQYSTL